MYVFYKKAGNSSSLTSSPCLKTLNSGIQIYYQKWCYYNYLHETSHKCKILV